MLQPNASLYIFKPSIFLQPHYAIFCNISKQSNSPELCSVWFGCKTLKRSAVFKLLSSSALYFNQMFRVRHHEWPQGKPVTTAGFGPRVSAHCLQVYVKVEKNRIGPKFRPAAPITGRQLCKCRHGWSAKRRNSCNENQKQTERESTRGKAANLPSLLQPQRRDFTIPWFTLNSNGLFVSKYPPPSLPPPPPLFFKSLFQSVSPCTSLLSLPFPWAW